MKTNSEFWFNFESERWAVGNYDLHCGDCFQLYDGHEWLNVRIEMAESWYLIVGSYVKDPNLYAWCYARTGV